LLAVAVHLVVNVGTYNVNEAVNAANRVISVLVVHACHLLERAEHLIISVASV
jgi:hypothetical protein